MLKDDDVVDAAVVGLDDNIKGHVPFGFIVLKKGIINVKLNYSPDLLRPNCDQK